MSLVIDVNSRVAQMLKEATAAAQPIWVGPLENGKEPFSRLSTFLEPDDRPDWHFNINEMIWGTMIQRVIDGMLLSHTATGPSFFSGPLTHVNGGPPPARMLAGDRIWLPKGSLWVHGKLI